MSSFVLKKSRKGANQSNPAFQKELLYNLATALMQENDVAAAEDVFKAAVGAAEATNDSAWATGMRAGLCHLLRASVGITKSKTFAPMGAHIM